MNEIQIMTARGLPNETYISPEFFKEELTKIHAANWICVGFGADAPRPGDVYPTEFAGLPLVLVRDRSGSLRVFHNVCPHRGMRLVREPGQNKRSLVCSYHCWTYDLLGKLVARPFFKGPDDSKGKVCETEDIPLVTEVRSAQWLDAVFVNLDGQAPPLEEYLSDFLEIADAYGGCKEAQFGGSALFEINANWKLVSENFVDSYHLPWIHPKSLEPSTPMITYRHEVKGNLSIGRAPFQGSQPGYGGAQMPKWRNISAESEKLLTYIVLFPNTLVVFTSTRFSIFSLNPVAPDKTIERISFYMPDIENPAVMSDRETFMRSYSTLNAEDVWVVEELQRSRQSNGFDGGCFSPYWDTLTYHIAQQVSDAMGIGANS